MRTKQPTATGISDPVRSRKSLQLVGDLDEDFWEAHVPPYAHGYVNYLFVPPRPDAGAWLDARIAEIIAAKPRRGSDPSRV